MMKNALPLLAAGAAILFLGGKKKNTKKSNPPSTEPEPEPEPDDEDSDKGSGPSSESEEYGKVASGLRKDKRGHFTWRIMYEEDGYHAHIMTDKGRFARIDVDVGVAATQAAAKKMLRDFFNQALLDANFSEEDFREHPLPESPSPKRGSLKFN